MTNQQPIISMPLSYWENQKDFWHIKSEWLEKAKHNGGIIAKLKDGTILKVGADSNAARSYPQVVS